MTTTIYLVIGKYDYESPHIYQAFERQEDAETFRRQCVTNSEQTGESQYVWFYVRELELHVDSKKDKV